MGTTSFQRSGGRQQKVLKMASKKAVAKFPGVAVQLLSKVQSSSMPFFSSSFMGLGAMAMAMPLETKPPAESNITQSLYKG